MNVRATPFGERVASIRKSMGIAQSRVSGIGQPQLSKIENGKETASAALIDRLAAALGRTPVELVTGTDREGYYVGQRLRPEEREELSREQRLKDATTLEYLYLFYTRICDMFEALYGGGIVPAFRGEEAYIEMVSNCKKRSHLWNASFRISEQTFSFPIISSRKTTKTTCDLPRIL